MKHPILIPRWPLPVLGEPGVAPDVDGLRAAGHPVIIGGMSPHDRSRSYLVARALTEHPDAEALVFLDDDTDATVAEVEQLVASYERVVRESPEPVATLSGLYFCRHLAERGHLGPSVTFDLRESAAKVVNVSCLEHGGIYPVFGSGFGCIVVATRVFREMHVPTAIYEDLEGRSYAGRAWFLPVVVDQAHLGEDRSFCLRVGQQGLGQQFVDTRLCVSHAGWRLVPPGKLARGRPAGESA